MEKSRDWLCVIVCIVSSTSFAFTRLTTSEVTKMAVAVNSTVTLRCQTDTHEPIRWAFTESSSRQPEVVIYAGYPGQWREAFQHRFAQSFNITTAVSRLTIDQVQLSDSGEYRCLEMNSSIHFIRFHLYVSDYGNLRTDDMTYKAVNVNESVIFRCTVNTLEPIRWVYTGSSINQSAPLVIYNGHTVRKELASRFHVTTNSSTGDSQLSVRSAEPSDTGTYSCKLFTATSQKIDFLLVVIGVADMTTATITVPVNPIERAVGKCITTDTSNLSVGVNSCVTLLCKTDTYQPIRWSLTAAASNLPEVMIYTGYPGQWREGFQHRFTECFNNTIGVSRLTINQVQLSDAGEYRCLEMNSFTHFSRFHLHVSAVKDMATTIVAASVSLEAPYGSTVSPNLSMFVAVGCLMMTVLVAFYVIALLWKGGRLRYSMFDKHPDLMSLPSTGGNTLRMSTSLDIVAMYAEGMKGSVRSGLLRPSTESCTQFVYAQVLPKTQRPVSLAIMETDSDNVSATSFQAEAVRASRTFSAVNINASSTAQDYYPPPAYAEINPRPH